MKSIKILCRGVMVAALSLCANVSFALTQNNVPNPGGGSVAGTGGADAVVTGTNNGLTYLQYGLWAMSVVGILAIAFMLMNNAQDTMLKHVIKIVAVISLAALAFTAPTWFGLPIDLSLLK